MSVSALIVTPGAATANAYVSLAVADQYHLDRPFSDVWTAATTDQKSAAILWATKLMDLLWVWSGYPVDAIQALAWPRGAILRRNGWEYESLTAIPIEIQHATAEYARQLLESDRTADSDVETQGLTDLTVGPIRLSFKDSVYAKSVPDAVYNMIPHGGQDFVYAVGTSDWGYVRSRVTGVRQSVRV